MVKEEKVTATRPLCPSTKQMVIVWNSAIAQVFSRQQQIHFQYIRHIFFHLIADNEII